MTPTKKHFRKRDAILTCLRQTKCHPSAEWIYHQLKPEIPDLSLGTVYRNLTLFKEQGLILSLGTVNGIERFDGETTPHVHLICTDCGNVLDLEEICIPASLAEEAGRFGKINACHVTFHGTCQSCLNKEKAV